MTRRAAYYLVGLLVGSSVGLLAGYVDLPDLLMLAVLWVVYRLLESY